MRVDDTKLLFMLSLISYITFHKTQPLIFFNSGLCGYWHCGHSWPIVPASGVVKMIVEKQMECRLAGEKPKFSEKTCPSATFVHHRIPHDQTRAAAVGSRRQTA
jgi:hypothetical protein